MCKPQDNAGLIVDFPKRRRLARTRDYKGVRFSSMAEIRVVEPHGADEVNKLWYSHQEEKAMRSARTKSVETVRELWSNNSSNDSAINDQHNTRDLDLCGIELAISPKSRMMNLLCRQHCINGVLDEQARQAKSGGFDADKLAFASLSCSVWAAKRAYQIGLFQSQL